MGARGFTVWWSKPLLPEIPLSLPTIFQGSSGSWYNIREQTVEQTPGCYRASLVAAPAPKELTPKSGALVFPTSRVLQSQLLPAADTALPFQSFHTRSSCKWGHFCMSPTPSHWGCSVFSTLHRSCVLMLFWAAWQSWLPYLMVCSCTGTAADWTELPIISTDTNTNICGYASHFFLIGSKLKFWNASVMWSVDSSGKKFSPKLDLWSK